MVDRKERFALLSRYKKLCKDSGRPVPQMNMNIDQWSADALIESYGLAGCYDLLAYYFSISPYPTWDKFARSAGDLLESRKAKEQDDAFRLEMRERAKAWLND
jgi:hypothetical protein